MRNCVSALCWTGGVVGEEKVKGGKKAVMEDSEVGEDVGQKEWRGEWMGGQKARERAEEEGRQSKGEFFNLFSILMKTMAVCVSQCLR